jgi:hypothetical protein
MRVPEAVADLNKLLRGWGGYFHYRQSTRVFGKTQAWVRDRLRRWLWRKHNRTKALWGDYPNELLHDRYGLWRLPSLTSYWNERKAPETGVVPISSGYTLGFWRGCEERCQAQFL